MLQLLFNYIPIHPFWDSFRSDLGKEAKVAKITQSERWYEYLQREEITCWWSIYYNLGPSFCLIISLNRFGDGSKWEKDLPGFLLLFALQPKRVYCHLGRHPFEQLMVRFKMNSLHTYFIRRVLLAGNKWMSSGIQPVDGGGPCDH